MQKLGEVVFTKGRFTVVERIENHADGTLEVVGHSVHGPGADSSWLCTLNAAVAQAEKLAAEDTSA
ncbi:hypothetical protein IB229_18070 [Pseudomonas sp. PDM14]|uniref:hypothetical protein n=1 Tax=Pseudomonas sp. PDM14 TaxID=2769288 RepID=UPI00177ABBA4|nr:hypothetical protein [Pseudomonas sp. PDM14]MBD9484893.1 hypothetical protein [Pseudomonas sp. PDM14]